MIHYSLVFFYPGIPHPFRELTFFCFVSSKMVYICHMLTTCQPKLSTLGSEPKTLSKRRNVLLKNVEDALLIRVLEWFYPRFSSFAACLESCLV